ncbi:MAG: S8 family serine peptidase [Gammaproteobacteria bacterium]|nr:S8 family serine peptidase [Gammaproteobacteria bacterium]
MRGPAFIRIAWLGGAVLPMLLSLVVAQAHASTLVESPGSQVHQKIVVTLDLPSMDAPRFSPSGRMSYMPISPEEYRRQMHEQAEELARQFDLAVDAQWPIHVLGVNCVVYRINESGRDAASVAGLMNRIRHHDGVDAVQAMNSFVTAGSASQGSSLPETGSFDDILENLAIKGSGRNVSIAVVDTGVDLAHSSLEDAELLVSNLVNDADVSFPPETHGTAIVGLLLAHENRALGIRGAVPKATTHLLRACWEVSEESDLARCNTFTLARALAAAVESEAEVVNLSISGPRDPLLERIAARILDEGRVLVAAGDSRNGFPGSVEGSILAINHFDADRNAMTLLPGNRYGLRKGSSVAAAKMTALVTLIKERDPGLGNAEILDYVVTLRQESFRD